MAIKTVRLVAINILVLLLFLSIVELAFAIYYKGYKTSHYIPDVTFHHIHPKNFKVYVNYNHEFEKRHIDYDETGYRVNHDTTIRKNNAEQIWFLGDSFTEANQVEWNHSFVGYIDSVLKSYECKNYGVTSYSPLFYYLQIKNELVKSISAPKLVIIQLFENDIQSDENYFKESKFDLNNQLIAIDGTNKNRFISSLKKSYTYRHLRKTMIKLKWMISDYYNKENPKTTKSKVINEYIELSPYIDSIKVFSKYIVKIDSLLNSKKIEHYFICVPSKYSCQTGDWSFNSFSKNADSFLRKINIPIIDLDSAFQYDSKNKKLFFIKDIHINAEGHKLVGKTVLNYLKRNNILHVE